MKTSKKPSLTYNQRDTIKTHGKKKYRVRKQLEKDGQKEIVEFKRKVGNGN